MTLTIPERRAAVGRLISDGLSNRAIAARLGISKDTVRRDLDALNGPVHTTTPLPAPARATEPHRARTPRLRQRHRRTPLRQPAPDPGRTPATITITVDDWTWRALRWCATAGHTDPHEAIRWALGETAARIHAERTAAECGTNPHPSDPEETIPS